MNDLKSILAIHRAWSLRSDEKLKLQTAVENGAVFRDFGRTNLEQLLQRDLRIKNWEPQQLYELAENDYFYINNNSIGVLLLNSQEYPAVLKEVYDPPFILFGRGDLSCLFDKCISVVGTRYPDGRGILSAEKFAAELAEQGCCVVSGLAKGIDAAAHRGCVKAGGKTAAVLGSGIDQIYPQCNRALAVAILKNNGCILSEYSPGMLPAKYQFPKRNRIISGLSSAVMVIQAPVKSGALISVSHALESGRDVFVHSRCMDGERGEGCRLLYEDGASAIDSVSQMFNHTGERVAFCGLQPALPGIFTEPDRQL